MTNGRSQALVIRLLGAPEILKDGQRMAFDTRKAVALLAYLAETARRHTREDLAALLWPESDRSRARSALRRTLSSASRVGPALIVDRAALQLDPDAVDCDVRTFSEQTGDSIAAAREAVRLYRGDFLEGFTLRDSTEFEDWRATVQDRLRRELDRHLTLLVDDLVSHGDLHEAIELTGRRLQMDPLNESAHQSLMALYEWNGQRSDSLRQYRRCVRSLERELGVAPLPETTAVYDAVRRHRLPRPGALDTSDVEAGGAPPRAVPPTQDTADRGRSRLFVGRSAELEAAAGAWRQAAKSGHALAVIGEVGSGKTALLTTFATSLRDGAHVTVVTVRGHEGEQDLAYGAATDLVRLIVDSNLEHAGSADWAALSWLAPLGAGPATRPPAFPTGRAQVFDAVRTAVGQVASSTPGGLLLVVEDVHWLDPESADLLAYVVRRPTPGTMLLMSWRGSSSPTAVAAALTEALEGGYGSVVRLGPLTDDEVADVLAAHGQDTDGSIVRQVRESTGGLPLLVVEAAQAASLDGLALSSDVDALVRARIDAAPETTRQVVTAIAVVGAPLEPDQVREISGRSEQEVVAALDDAVARGLLVELRERGEYDVPHGTLRRLAAGTASAARRRLLHSRASDALAGSSGRPDRGPGWSARVAHHLELAGRSDEAADWYERAAQEAAAVSGHATAELHWEAALALGRDRWTCHLGIGDARVRLGHYAGAIEAYEQAAAASLTDEQLALVERRLGGVHDRLGEYDVAEAHVESALALLGASPDSGAVRRGALLADLALVSLRLGDPDRARQRARVVIDSEPAFEDDALAQAYDVLGVVAARAGDLGSAREHLQSSLIHVARSGDSGVEIAALNNLARVEARAGCLDEALDLAHRALERSAALADTHRTAALHDHLADLLHRVERDDEAREHQRKAASLFAAVDREPDRRPEIWQLSEW